MAPTVPSKRKFLRAKALERLANPLLPRKAHRENNSVSDAFIDSKKDKRIIRHSAFVSKITKSRPGSSATRNAAARKRRKQQLATTLEGLADALPELTEEDGSIAELSQGKLRHKSLKSRPGALKRKERLVKGEMQRFGANLAQLAGVKEAPAAVVEGDLEIRKDDEQETQQLQQQPVVQQSTANRFAALRSFISATMEQNPAFTNTEPRPS